MKIPKIITGILATWKKVGLWIGKKVAWLIMSLVYLVLFAPIAIVIHRRYRFQRTEKRDSYFIAHDASSDTLYEHQF